MSLYRELMASAISFAAERARSPKAAEASRIGEEPGTLAYHRGYAYDQYMKKVVGGCTHGVLIPALFGKRVLEIGCGHGGISCYLSSIGASEVVGIDLNEPNLEIARHVHKDIEKQIGRDLPVVFSAMDAHALTFDDESFDVVFADNLFEHVSDPQQVLAEAFRVLRPGGMVVAPAFSSIHSKWGLHLKWGLRMPWLNAVFAEDTIVRALQKSADKRPSLYEVYPGLKNQPETVRDVRAYKDLNDIDYEAFVEMARVVGFQIETFRVNATPVGRIVGRVAPTALRSRLLEYLSTSASAVLMKPTPMDRTP